VIEERHAEKITEDRESGSGIRISIGDRDSRCVPGRGDEVVILL